MELPDQEVNHHLANNSTNNDEDMYFTLTSIVKIMRKILPANAKIADDSKETIQQCASEFISFITAAANESCQQDKRKTITAEDVIQAMKKLGFDDYVKHLSLCLYRYREIEGHDRESKRSSIPLVRRTVADQPNGATTSSSGVDLSSLESSNGRCNE